MDLNGRMRGRDVTINAVAPGPTATALFLNGKDEETIARFASQPPLERLRTVELDIASQDSCDAAIESILAEQGSLDVVIHNAGHMVTGPTEAFTPDEIARVYDTNVLGTQRLNRAALPHLRASGSNRRSSYRARSRTAPTTSPTAVDPPTSRP